MTGEVVNMLTVDVEDYFMVSAFASVVRRDEWHLHESRVERNTNRILDLLDEHATRATFFILGCIADRFPGLVREIHGRGHEIGCHSYDHRLVRDLGPQEFETDTKRAKAVLEDVAGTTVLGYRAPSYSITRKSLWALDILARLGFAYDSSIFPIRHDRYGYPGFGRFPRRVDLDGGAQIVEVPPSTIRVVGKNIPIAGGGYLRLYPLALTEWGIRKLNRDGRQAVVYVHPWEIDPDQPRIDGGARSRFRHYVGIARTLDRLRNLLRHFPFAPMADVLARKGFLHNADAAEDVRNPSFAYASITSPRGASSTR